MEKQLQQQLVQMTNLQKQLQQKSAQNNSQEMNKELDQIKTELQAANVERERYAAQLEMLVQELEKSQVSEMFPIIIFIIFFKQNKF